MTERGMKGAQRVTNRLAWPRDAADARDESAMQTNEIIALLEPVLNGDSDQRDIDRIVGRVINAANKICRLLEREGAPTIPTR